MSIRDEVVEPGGIDGNVPDRLSRWGNNENPRVQNLSDTRLFRALPWKFKHFIWKACRERSRWSLLWTTMPIIIVLGICWNTENSCFFRCYFSKYNQKTKFEERKVERSKNAPTETIPEKITEEPKSEKKAPPMKSPLDAKTQDEWQNNPESHNGAVRFSSSYDFKRLKRKYRWSLVDLLTSFWFHFCLVRGERLSIIISRKKIYWKF